MSQLLVIDDDPLVRAALEEFLNDEGYTVHTAIDGKDGLQVFQQTNPDVVILDLKMPRMGGIKFLEQLNFGSDLTTSVVVLTAFDTNEDIKRCYELGVQSFLRKPVNLVELGALVKRLLEMIHQSSRLQQTIRKKESDFQQLEQEHDKLKKTFNSMREGIVVLDKNLNIEMLSELACQILEMDEQAVVGKQAGAVLPSSIVGPNGALSKCIQEQSGLADVRVQHDKTVGKSKSIMVSITPTNSTSIEDGWLLFLKHDIHSPQLPPRPGRKNAFGRIISVDPQMKEIFQLIKKISSSKAAVLIQGNSGTGKELVAREIHDRSPRSNRPFHAVNCAAISSQLLESEFFGHEKGAFTGAHQLKKGRFELADGGTLFLDEVGELPLELQGKLLRAIQEQVFERVGGTQSIKVDVRIVAATNRDLKAMAGNNTFREDLYYRLNVVPVSLPDLSERQDDIPLLVDAFVQELNRREGREIQGISKAALKKLSYYSWPGNIRELYNVIEYAFAVSQGETLQIDDFPPDIQKLSAPFNRNTLSAEKEKDLMLETLQKTNYHKLKAAGLLGMHPATFYRKLKRYGIS